MDFEKKKYNYKKFWFQTIQPILQKLINYNKIVLVRQIGFIGFFFRNNFYVVFKFIFINLNRKYLFSQYKNKTNDKLNNNKKVKILLNSVRLIAFLTINRIHLKINQITLQFKLILGKDKTLKTLILVFPK